MKIALIGYGKMGKVIEKLALQKGHEVVLKIGSQNFHEMTDENLSTADVAIEFSRPETAFNNIVACLRGGTPIVSGTTAWLEKLEEAKAVCSDEKGAFFYASNFSIGVNLFFALNRQLAKMMELHQEYNVSIEEIHHTEKLDHPSGTAVTLAEGILAEVSRKKNWVSKLAGSLSPKKQSSLDEIHILSKREEGVPRTHIINWSSEIDTLEISHTSHSREGFALGALHAAEWLVGKKGVFGMEDMMGI